MDPGAAMALTQPALITALKASIGKSADAFTAASDADFKRHLAYAARDYSRRRPLTLSATLALVAGQPNYSPPGDLWQVKSSEWGRKQRNGTALWDRSVVHELPRLEYTAGEIWLLPAPTAAQITCFGSAYQFFYYAAHQVTASTVTVPEEDEMLLITRAQAEAAKELAAVGLTSPVAPWHNGLQSISKPMTPAAIHKLLMETFERVAG